MNIVHNEWTHEWMNDLSDNEFHSLLLDYICIESQWDAHTQRSPGGIWQTKRKSSHHWIYRKNAFILFPLAFRMHYLTVIQHTANQLAVNNNDECITFTYHEHFITYHECHWWINLDFKPNQPLLIYFFIFIFGLWIITRYWTSKIERINLIHPRESE